MHFFMIFFDYMKIFVYLCTKFDNHNGRNKQKCLGS